MYHTRVYALRLGADEVVVSRNVDEMQKHAGSFVHPSLKRRCRE
jgi:hypothetical protein